MKAHQNQKSLHRRHQWPIARVLVAVASAVVTPTLATSPALADGPVESKLESNLESKFDGELQAVYTSLTPALLLKRSSAAEVSTGAGKVDQLRKQLVQCEAQGRLLETCYCLLSLAREPLAISDLAKAELLLDRVKTLQGKLSLSEQKALLTCYLQLAATLSGPGDNLRSKEMVLKAARGLTETMKNVDAAWRLGVLRGLGAIYKGTSRGSLAVEIYGEILALNLGSARDAAAILESYENLAAAQLQNNDKKSAGKTIDAGLTLGEKLTGKLNLRLVPLLIEQIKADEVGHQAVLSKLCAIVDNYGCIPVLEAGPAFAGDERAYQTGRELQQFAGDCLGRKPISDDQRLVAKCLAQKGYELCLKAKLRFDETSFLNLAVVLEGVGDYKDLAGLYRETIEYLSGYGQEKRLDMVRSGYARALRLAGDESAAAKEQLQLKAIMENKASEARRADENRLATLETMADADAIDVLAARIKVLKYLLADADSAKVKHQLQAISTAVSDYPAGQMRLSGLDSALVLCLRQAAVTSVFDSDMKKLVTEIFSAMESKIQTGLGQSAITALNFKTEGNSDLFSSISDAVAQVRAKRLADRPDDFVSLSLLEQMAEGQGKFSQAAALQQKIVAKLALVVPPDRHALVQAQLLLAQLALSAEERGLAQEAFVKGIRLMNASDALSIDVQTFSKLVNLIDRFIGNKQYDTADSGIRKAIEIDCSATVAKSSAPYFKIDVQLARLLSAYQQDHLYEKAVELQQFIVDSYKTSGVKNDGVIALAQAELANLRLLSVDKTKPAAESTNASDEQFRQAMSKIADFYGAESGEFKSALSRRMALLQSLGEAAAAAALSKEHW
jgi:hypothetical protein